MAEAERLRLYIRYDVLFAAEFRSILGGLERAYNRIDCFVGNRRRVRAEDRLRITSVHTEKSIEAFLGGNANTIIGLALLVHVLQRERRLYWQTQKAKWDAKLAEKKFHEPENLETEERIGAGLRKEDRNLMKAIDSLSKAVKQIARSPRIISVEIQFVSDDDSSEIKRPKRSIILDDN